MRCTDAEERCGGKVHLKETAEKGEMQPQAKKDQAPPGATGSWERLEQIPPWPLGRNHHPANTWISDFWPPEMSLFHITQCGVTVTASLETASGALLWPSCDNSSCPRPSHCPQYFSTTAVPSRRGHLVRSKGIFGGNSGEMLLASVARGQGRY